MKRKWWWWLGGIIAGVVLLGTVAILCLDPFLKRVAERRIREQTGLEAKIQKLTVSLTRAKVTVQGLQIFNPPEFGPSVLLDLPELSMEIDRNEASAGRLHFKEIRFHLKEFNVIRNKEGRFNVQAFEKHSRTNAQTSDLWALVSPPALTNETPAAPEIVTPEQGAGTQPPASTEPAASPNITNDLPLAITKGQRLKFGGIDRMYVTWEKVNYIDFKDPRRNEHLDLQVDNLLVQNLRTEEDFTRWYGGFCVRIAVRMVTQQMEERPEQAQGFQTILKEFWKTSGLRFPLDFYSKLFSAPE